jgi:hypothetical protein
MLNVKCYEVNGSAKRKYSMPVYTFMDTVEEYYSLHYSTSKDRFVGSMKLRSGKYGHLIIKNIYTGTDVYKVRIYTSDTKEDVCF